MRAEQCRRLRESDMVAILQQHPPQFRRMRVGDLARVSEIEALSYPFPWSRVLFGDCLRAGYDCCVLTEGEDIVGYGILSSGASESHILNVCVAPDVQSRGHGRRIVKRLLDLARCQRSERVFLEVRPSNVHAIALYESIGFNEFGRRPNYYPSKRGREDALVMAMEMLPP